MGAFIAKQPNGLYCRFSTVVDCPTDWNMTEEDYIELCAERAREQARETLERHLRPFEMVKEYFRPMNMTEVEFEECLKEMSELPPEHIRPVLNMDDGCYVEFFAVKNGARYNATIVNLRDMTRVLTNGLLDSIEELWK